MIKKIKLLFKNLKYLCNNDLQRPIVSLKEIKNMERVIVKSIRDSNRDEI